MSWQSDEEFCTALSDFAAMLNVLDPIRDDIVIAGGVAAFLYRYADPLSVVSSNAILTYDLDLALPRTLVNRRNSGLGNLIAESDLEIVHTTCSNPAKAVLARKGRRSNGQAYPAIYSELLTDAQGADPGILEFGGGLNVSELRYLRVLLAEPLLRIDLTQSGEPLLAPLGVVSLPHPFHFIMQKILMERATPLDTIEKEGKDAAYIVEVIQMFFRDLDEWRRRWISIVKNEEFPKKWLDRCVSRFDERFGNPQAAGVQGASRELTAIAATPENQPEPIARLLRRFSERVIQAD